MCECMPCFNALLMDNNVPDETSPLIEPGICRFLPQKQLGVQPLQLVAGVSVHVVAALR